MADFSVGKLNWNGIVTRRGGLDLGYRSQSGIERDGYTGCLTSVGVNPVVEPAQGVSRLLWRMSETDDGQKARNACNIGTQPVRPTVYGVNAPL